jgi:hypothetical protein
VGKGWGEDEPPLGSSHRSDVLRARRIAYETYRVPARPRALTKPGEDGAAI